MKSKAIRVSSSSNDGHVSFTTTLHQTGIDIKIEVDKAPTSDHDYAFQLQLQEALISSLNPSETTNPLALSSVNQEPSLTPPNPAPQHPAESSQSLCEICASFKDNDQFFPLPNCTHKFCTECITKHVSIQIRSLKRAFPLPCPGSDCDAVLELDTCRRVLPHDVVAKMDDVICESMIEPSQKFYCLYKECSALLVKDDESVREAECLACRRLICVRCNVPWHAEMSCDEFSKLGKWERGSNDRMLHNMAKKKRWQRCGVCKIYVAKRSGCARMKCRCGHRFCYRCGATLSSRHYDCL